jgi:hypothetical protein
MHCCFWRVTGEKRSFEFRSLYVTTVGPLRTKFSVSDINVNFTVILGRAIAQAVSRRLPTAAARVRAQVMSCGIYDGQKSLRQIFSEYFDFLWQFSFHRLLHTRHRPSSGAGRAGQIVADVASRLSLTLPQEIKLKNKINYSCPKEGIPQYMIIKILSQVKDQFVPVLMQQVITTDRGLNVNFQQNVILESRWK